MTKHSIVKFCALAAGILSIPAVSTAGTQMAAAKESKPVIEAAKESCITGDLGINVVSQYISRGLVFENQGAILQPYADLYFQLYKTETSGATLNLGIWNSFHSEKTDAGLADDAGGFIGERRRGSTTDSWYEFDFTAGISFTFAKNFVLTPSYFTFLSPADGFATFHGVNVKLAYDTTDLLGINIAPYVQVLWEAENKAGNGADEGFYYEVGIAPSLPAGPVTVSFPLVAGFGSNEFYATGDDDLAYGFSSAGVILSYTLQFIPECYGTWTATAGATAYHLSTESGLKTFNENNVRDRDHMEYVFSGGLSVAF